MKTRPKSKKLKITNREVQILFLIWEYRFLTAEQIVGYFDKEWYPQNKINTTLIALSRKGYLVRPEQAPNTRFYMLGSEGAKCLNVEYGLDLKDAGWESKAHNLSAWSFRPHETAIRDFMISLEALHAKGKIKLIRQSDIAFKRSLSTRQKPFVWKTTVYWQGRGGEVTVNPDWFFGFADTDTYYALEIDKASKTINNFSFTANRFILKTLLAYAHTFDNKVAQTEFGLSVMNVIFVTTGKKRMENMQECYREYAESIARPARFLFALDKDISTKSILKYVFENGVGDQVSL